MAIARTKIGEHDCIELLHSIGAWPAGTGGTVVSDHGDSKLIEVSDDRGQMLDLFEVPESQLKLVGKYSR